MYMNKRADGTCWVKIGEILYEMNWGPDCCDKATPLFTGRYHRRGKELCHYVRE